MDAVATLSGNRSALDSVRPLSSFRSFGTSMVNCAFSANGAAKVKALTLASGARLGSTCGARWPDGVVSTTCSACLRGTGAENVTDIGRSGVHGDCACSRSQLKLAVKGSRTV
ncbi:hypothetical protein D3C81_876900 [compost metagenome]